MNERLKAISRQTMERYSTRFKELGYNVRTLGWGSVEQQRYRFAQTLRFGLDFDGTVVADFGCGFGDYYDFLMEAGAPIKKYIGWDINPDLIAEAKKRYSAHNNTHFSCEDLTVGEYSEPVADIGVMLGVLNFNLKTMYDNYVYSELMISHAFKLVKKALIVDFLSTRLCQDYPKEDFVFYHEPVRMLEFGLTLSSNVTFKHDYRPIPQKEFMLVIQKSS